MIKLDFVVWRKIEGYDKNYEVSTDGRIREVLSNNNYLYLKTTQSISGYIFIDLLKNNRLSTVPVDFLVASTFIKNPTNKEFITHLDGRTTNNRVENLKWFDFVDIPEIKKELGITVYRPSEEQKAITSLKNSGKRNKRARTVIQYSTKAEFIKKWDCIAEAERELDIKGISRACKKSYSTAGGFLWRYEGEEVKPLFGTISL